MHLYKIIVSKFVQTHLPNFCLFFKSLKLWNCITLPLLQERESPIFVYFSLFVVCQDFIADMTDDAVVPDIFDETSNELPATPPPTAVSAAGNDSTLCKE